MRKFRSFKPYYNWNTFNTELSLAFTALGTCFKPYYNWNTFNTLNLDFNDTGLDTIVLNLIITGIPSIPLI